MSDPSLDELTALLKSDEPSGSRFEQMQGRNAFLRRVQAQQHRGRNGARYALLAAAAALAALLVWVGWPGDPTLDYRLADGLELKSNEVYAPRKGALAFSDGSRIELEPETRAGIDSVSARGATLWVREGSVHADIEPRKGGQWRLRAGPFSVRVVGTRFDVSWDPAEQSFRVQVREGRVRVGGPGAPRKLLGAGESFEWRPNETAAPASPKERDQLDATSELVRDQKAPQGDERRPALPASKQAEAAGGTQQQGSSWSDLVNAGHYGQVLEQVAREGEQRALAFRPLADLVALADAARFSGRAQLAIRALTAQRTRFPRSAAGGSSLFWHALVCEELQGDVACARSRYAQYLASGADAYREQALGRLATLSHAAGQRARAQTYAQRYLEAFPSGPYAAAARRIVED